MKKSKVLLLMVALCACLAGCGEDTETTNGANVETEEMVNEMVEPDNAIGENATDVEEVAPEDAAAEEN